ncbi:unnamed protein product [Allacma fusca]|uniref:Secreted protein n=1 Tax=Allacma fusca TaxID=39272 RepID=A0A8J2P0I7_9HEXA|nr:unnamed protein product [Allacma fusca]
MARIVLFVITSGVLNLVSVGVKESIFLSQVSPKTLLLLPAPEASCSRLVSQQLKSILAFSIDLAEFDLNW